MKITTCTTTQVSHYMVQAREHGLLLTPGVHRRWDINQTKVDHPLLVFSIVHLTQILSTW